MKCRLVGALPYTLVITVFMHMIQHQMSYILCDLGFKTHLFDSYQLSLGYHNTHDSYFIILCTISYSMKFFIYFDRIEKKGYLLSLLNSVLFFLFTNQALKQSILHSGCSFGCLRDLSVSCVNTVVGYLLTAQQC